MCCGKENKAPVRYNAGEMNRQVVISYPVVNQPYFYSTKQGGGNGIEFEAASNFDNSNLDDSLLHSMGKFSSADGEEEEREYEDEDNIEYENEESEYEASVGDDIPANELPKFRELVRNKKLELKSQYGKAKISVFECGVKPLNPDIRYPNVPCIWDCSKSKNYGKDCCAKNREQAQKRAEQRDKIAAWEKCRTENKGIIVWGWRKRWRDFKRTGGLAQLRMQAKGLTPIPTPSSSTPSIVTPPSTIIPNTSSANVINKPLVIKMPSKKLVKSERLDKFGKGKKGAEEAASSTKENGTESDSSEKKFLGMPKKVGIAVAIVGGLALAFGGYKLYVKLKK